MLVKMCVAGQGQLENRNHSCRVDDLSRLVEAGGEAVAVQPRATHALHVKLHELQGRDSIALISILLI